MSHDVNQLWLEGMIEHYAEYGRLPKPQSEDEADMLEQYGEEIKREAINQGLDQVYG